MVGYERLYDKPEGKSTWYQERGSSNFNSSSGTARAGNHHFGLLSAPSANKQAPYKPIHYGKR